MNNWDEQFFFRAKEKIVRNHEVFNRLKVRALRAFSANDPLASMKHIQIAADYAWRNHHGDFVSIPLENCLEQLAARLSGHHLHRGGRRSAPSNRRGRVLHIATQVFSIGGHTRLIRRWADFDSENIHDLVLTRQLRARIPDGLKDALENQGGQVFDLQSQISNLLDRVIALSKLILSYEKAILHIHPSDVTAILGVLCCSEPTQIGFMNHADHVFWIGAKSASNFIHFRESSIRHSEFRRGLARETASYLPLPIQVKKPHLSRSRARAELGLGQNDVIAVSIASEEKYVPIMGVDFLSIHKNLVLSSPKLKLFVIGPKPAGRWAKVQSSTDEAIIALGRRTDVEVFLCAADIYIDSFPFSSVTSYLEAAAHGVPVLSYDPWNAKGGVVHSDDPVIPLGKGKYRNLEEYKEMFLQFAQNEKIRKSEGAEAKHRLNLIHGEENWVGQLQKTYADLMRNSMKSIPFPSKEMSDSRDYEFLDYLNVLKQEDGKILDIDRVISKIFRNLGLVARP